MAQRERIAELEFQMRPKGIDYDRIYTALHQMEVCTSPLAPDETQEQWEAKFVEKYGTREQFIENGKLKEAQHHDRF